MADEIDWRDPRCAEGIMHVMMVSQTNPNMVIKEVTGVNWEDSNLTFAYYSDTRCSGNLSLIDSNWERGPFLRFIYELPNFGYKKTLGTFVVTSENPVIKNGQQTNKLVLHSAALYTLSTDILERDWTINSGTRVSTAIKTNLSTACRPYVYTATYDKTFSSPVLIENNHTRLDILFSLAEQANLRIDADPDGRILVTNYTPPAVKSPSYVIDLDDPRGVAIDGAQPTSDFFENPGRVVVEYNGQDNTISEEEKKRRRKYDPNYTDQVNYVGVANARSGSYTDPSKRGYTVTKFVTLSNMVPSTQAKATSEAQARLSRLVAENISWTLSTIFLPIAIGDAIVLNVANHIEEHYNGTRRCFIKSIELDLQTMRMKLQLKEVAAYDKDENAHGALESPK